MQRAVPFMWVMQRSFDRHQFCGLGRGDAERSECPPFPREPAFPYNPSTKIPYRSNLCFEVLRVRYHSGSRYE